MAEQTDGKRNPKQKRTRLTRGQKGLIAGAAVLAVALVGVLAWRSVFVRPDLNAGKTPEPTQTEETTELVEEIDWGEGTRPRSDGERKSEDYYTVLILGRDTGGGGNTDTMLLASYDVTNQKATVMSIPRDTMVNVPWDIKKINSVYNYYGQGERGIQALYREISQLVGFEPDYQVIVEWEAVGEIVDAMGGVWFDVPRKMDYEDPYQDLSIHLDKGYQLLNGEQAMGVVRFRDGANGYKTGDLGRIETQQAFLKAMVEQLLKIENVTKINRFIEVFQKNVTTDLSFENILWFAKAAIVGGLKVEDVNFVTMPANYTAHAYSRYYSKELGRFYQLAYVTPYPNELLELVNSELSPYKEVFTLSDLDIMTVNADGSVRSSTGYVEDSQATHTNAYWQSLWQPQEPEEETPPVDENGNPIVTDPITGLPVTGGETTGPGPGGEETVIPDPGTGIDPDAGVVEPGTGQQIDPETGGIIDPSTGQILDPGTGQVIGQVPGSGDTAGEGGETDETAPETPEPSDEETASPPEEPAGGEAQAPDDGFIIVN